MSSHLPQRLSQMEADHDHHRRTSRAAPGNGRFNVGDLCRGHVSPIPARPVDPLRRLLQLTLEPPFPGSYLAAVTDVTEMVSPLAVPETLASSQASLLRLSSAA